MRLQVCRYFGGMEEDLTNFKLNLVKTSPRRAVIPAYLQYIYIHTYIL